MKAFELSILRIGCLIAKNNKFSFLVNGKELIQKLWNCFSPYLEISVPGSRTGWGLRTATSSWCRTWMPPPAETLARYFGRMDIESFFKTGKEYLSLLPLSKWTRETIDGKLLNDILSTIIYLKMRKALAGTGITMTRLFGRMKSEMFYGRNFAGVTIETFIQIINDYITWYNKKRIKASLGYMSPMECRQSLGLA